MYIGFYFVARNLSLLPIGYYFDSKNLVSHVPDVEYSFAKGNTELKYPRQSCFDPLALKPFKKEVMEISPILTSITRKDKSSSYLNMMKSFGEETLARQVLQIV